jgi:Zn-dependent peptidase ImmA (M78 family)
VFDVVIEFHRQRSALPHLYVVFECKNYEGAIPESAVNDFSSKLGRIFKHAAKGVIVVSSRLQSGAENVAKNSKMAIVKYNEYGLEIIAERKSRTYAEDSFVKAQIFENKSAVKPMKFSAYYGGRFFGSIDEFLACLDSNQTVGGGFASDRVCGSVPFTPGEDIKKYAQRLLEQIDYKDGSVDLRKICSKLSIHLDFTNQKAQDGNGNIILGSVNFDRKSIVINSHDDKNRERFTIAHEVGHFCLQHDQYLRSEYIVERDLIIDSEKENTFNFERLEFQANLFASNLLLPDDVFLRKTAEYREQLEFKNRGHGYIFVDDQPCNYGPYNMLVSNLSSDFEVSKQVIQIKFGQMGMLTDQRK